MTVGPHRLATPRPADALSGTGLCSGHRSVVSALRPISLWNNQRGRGPGWQGRPPRHCHPHPLAWVPRFQTCGLPARLAHALFLQVSLPSSPAPTARRPPSAGRTSTAARTSEEAPGSSGMWGVFVRTALLALSDAWAGIQLMIKPRARALQSMTSMTGSLGDEAEPLSPARGLPPSHPRQWRLLGGRPLPQHQATGLCSGLRRGSALGRLCPPAQVPSP